MKTILTTLASILLFSTSLYAGEGSRIASAAITLSEIAQGSHHYKVRPGDAKEMLLEFALKEGMVETVEEFESSWKGLNSEAWYADSLNWGLDNATGAYSYVAGVLKQDLEGGEGTQADKIKFAKSISAAKQAFQILRSVKSVRFGVAPTGAVQCGVTFASLFILDTETGDIYQIIMEGSGC